MCDFLILVSFKGVKKEPFHPHFSIKKQTGSIPEAAVVCTEKQMRTGRREATSGPPLSHSRNKTVKRCFYWSAGQADGEPTKQISSDATHAIM